MEMFITFAIVGLICIVIGISNMRGNISMLHSYHTHRVSEEDKPRLGKLVGIGMIIFGIAMIAMIAAGALITASIMLSMSMLSTVGYAVMISGMVVGLGLIFYALIKYNKGIF